jgi:hypothetical protein
LVGAKDANTASILPHPSSISILPHPSSVIYPLPMRNCQPVTVNFA